MLKICNYFENYFKYFLLTIKLINIFMSFMIIELFFFIILIYVKIIDKKTFALYIIEFILV